MDKDIAIIARAALQQHIAVLGKTGSGKTSTAKLAIEQVVAGGARVCVLDPIKSDWWGLTSSADGKEAGLPFHILGGPRGHVPLHAAAGKAIGELVASGGLPLSIIDMADFEAGEHTKFFVDFAGALLRRMRGVLYLVIEEAHEFAPKERAGFGAENLSIHWAKKLATAGRSKGIRLLVLTQRTQSLHNALLGSCDTLIAHRFTAPADQEPVVKWLRSNLEPELARQVAASLSSLKTGEGWLCAGEARIFERRQFPRIRTYDNTATPTGDSVEYAVKTAPVDKEKLRAIVGDAIKEAEASDPKLLRAEIARLRAELRKMPAESDAFAIAAARREGHQEGAREGYAAALRAVHPLTERLDSLSTAASEAIEAFRKDIRFLARGAAPATAPASAAAPAAGQPHVRVPRAERAATGPADASVGKSGLRRMLIALAQRPGGLNRRQLGLRAGLSSRSGTFDTYLSRGRTNGWIEGQGDIRITDAGLQALGSYEPLPEGRGLLTYWLEELGQSGAKRILKALADAYPRALSRAELGASAAMSDRSGTFDTYLSRLRTLELINGRGEIRATEELFDTPKDGAVFNLKAA